ncbi:hypothetical protein B7463_g9189, partial [Scytalidium lignicola]
MPLAYLQNWTPFRIDALGLVTLIGAEEVDKAVGRLVQSRYTKFLPLLGAYLIANNHFTANDSGYTLYNVSDAITTTSVSGWLTRWLDSQKLKTSTTVYEWNVSRMKKSQNWDGVIAAIIGTMLTSGLIALSTLMGDWWGLCNAMSMCASIFIRWYLVKENIEGLDQAALSVFYGSSNMKEGVKLLITLSDGKMVTIYAPRGLIKEAFTKRICPPRRELYIWGKRFGWLFFGVHIITLGQSDLLSQLYTVTLLIISTWATVHGLGCNEMEIGNHISVENMTDFPEVPDRRQYAYVRLQPTENEEQALTDWGLLPRKMNSAWWDEYRQSKKIWGDRGKFLTSVSYQEKV